MGVISSSFGSMTSRKAFVVGKNYCHLNLSESVIRLITISSQLNNYRRTHKGFVLVLSQKFLIPACASLFERINMLSISTYQSPKKTYVVYFGIHIQRS